jgi:hypothetical protein
VTYVGVALTLAGMGLIASATPALAHANVVTGTSACPTVAGTDFQVTWTVANDWNLPETLVVTAATGGISSVTQTTLVVPASGNGSGGMGQLPYQSVSFVQNLPQSVTGMVSLAVVGDYSDGYATSNSGQAYSPANCPVAAAPTPTTIAAPVPVAPSIPAVASPTAVPTPTLVTPTTTITPTASPVQLNVGHSTNGRKRPTSLEKRNTGRSTNSGQRPTLLASALPSASPQAPILKAASFTG